MKKVKNLQRIYDTNIDLVDTSKWFSFDAWNTTKTGNYIL